MLRVAWIHVAPVKGMAVVAPQEVDLGLLGVPFDRSFALIDDTRRVVNGKRWGALCAIAASFEPELDILTMTFGDGDRISARVRVAEGVTALVHGRPAEARIVPGPWDRVLPARFGLPLRLVKFDSPPDGLDRGGRQGTVTLVSQASVDEFSRVAGQVVDPRRFRMLLGIDGALPFEEDGWLGRRVRVGQALISPVDLVGRCAVTTFNPTDGGRDLDTLRILKDWRPGCGSTERLPFGVWGSVLEPGVVRMGDVVEALAGPTDE